MQENNFDQEREDELKDAPSLRAIGNSCPYQSPDGYFDTLHSRIQDRIQVAPRPWHARIQQPVWAVMLLVVIGAGILFNYYDKPRIADTRVSSEVSIDDLLNSGYYADLDEELISESLIQSGESTELKDIEEFLIESADESLLGNEL